MITNITIRMRLIFPTALWVRYCHQLRSTKREYQDVNKEVLSKTLCLRKIKHPRISSSESKPLVLFFPWLTAPSRALDRYCDIYHQRGWDVLTIKGHIKQFIWPSFAFDVTKEITDLITQEKEYSTCPLIVQGMSVGAYLFTVMMMRVQKDPQLLNNIAPRIRAQIFDSIVIGSLGHMSTGMAISLTTNPLLRALVTSSSYVYFAMTKRYTVDLYENAIQTFYNNPFGGPVLYFYSHNDPMCDSKAIGKLVNSMKNSERFAVTVKSWSESPHAGHLRAHQEDYLQTINSFLGQVDLSPRRDQAI